MLKNRRSKWLRTVSVILCMALILSIGVFAESIDEMKARQAQVQAEIDSLNNSLSALRGEEANKQAYSDTLEESITVTQQRIETARQDIETLNTGISALEAKLKESEGEYVASMELLKKRIKAIYQTGEVGTVEILLKSTSLYDFSLKTELLKSFTAHDKKLLSDIEAFMEKTAADRDSLNVQKAAVADLKKQREADQIQLEALMAENNLVIASLQSQQASTQTNLENKEQEDAALDAEIANLIEQERVRQEQERLQREEAERLRREEEERNAAASGGSSTGDSNSGGSGSGGSADTGGATGGDGSGMSDGFSPRWPLPGYGTDWITCYYGSGGHNGLDIAGNYGASIVAAQSGNVISADYHWSWGNNVLIYHNGTFSTRYAHMSSMAVSAGQYVERGQTIGYVGDTGYSFGNHLHFEVYRNGSRVDPYPYL